MSEPPASVAGEVPASLSGEREAAAEFKRSFKATLAALRRMRGRELRTRGPLSDAQYSLLFCLRASDYLSSGELAEAADLSPASVTEMLEGLADAGLVERTRSDRDRRVVLTALTERGRALVEARRAQVEPRFRAALAEFSDEELLIAAKVLDRFRSTFDEVAEEGDHPLGA